jgi:hypothetical protein
LNSPRISVYHMSEPCRPCACSTCKGALVSARTARRHAATTRLASGTSSSMVSFSTWSSQLPQEPAMAGSESAESSSNDSDSGSESGSTSHNVSKRRRYNPTASPPVSHCPTSLVFSSHPSTDHRCSSRMIFCFPRTSMVPFQALLATVLMAINGVMSRHNMIHSFIHTVLPT